MSDIAITTVSRYRSKPRPDITIAGKVWKPRRLADELGFTDRTAARMNWPTAYIAGVADCPEEENSWISPRGARRRNEPPHEASTPRPLLLLCELFFPTSLCKHWRSTTGSGALDICCRAVKPALRRLTVTIVR